MRRRIEARLHGRRAEGVDFIGVQRDAIVLYPLESLDDFGIVRRYLAGVVVHERAAECKAIGVVPALVHPRDKAHLGVVAVAVLDVELVGDLGHLIPGRRPVRRIERRRIYSGSLDHAPVVVEGPYVGVERQAIGIAIEHRLSRRKRHVVGHQLVGA